MKVSELTKLLTKNHCRLIAHGKEHDEWYSEITHRSFRVPRHQSKDIPKGTLNSILKDAGLK